MPEIKNQFTGGKMNKDLDERLVPKGEYRDAMNIQVTTSEESDVGSVQNILGNTPGCKYSELDLNPIPKNSYTVGSVSDEKNDSLYWMVAGNENLELNFNNFGNPIPGSSISFKDMIMRTNSNRSIAASGCEPVFVDKWKFCTAVEPSITDFFTNSIVLNDDSLYSSVVTGMTVTGFVGNNESFADVLVTHVGSSNVIPVYYSVNTIAVGPSTSSPTLFRIRTFEDANSQYASTVGNGTLLDSIYYDPSTVFLYNQDTEYPPTNLSPSGTSEVHIQLLWDMTGGNPPPPQEFLTVGATIPQIETQAGQPIFTSLPGQNIEMTVRQVRLEQLRETMGVFTNGTTFAIKNFDYYIIDVTITGAGGSLSPQNPLVQSPASYPPSGGAGQITQVKNYRPVSATAVTGSSGMQYGNVITVNSAQWLNEIYDASLDSTAEIKINNSIGAGVVWPQNSCIDISSITAPNPSYDNVFSIVQCGTSGISAVPHNAFGTTTSGLAKQGELLTFEVTSTTLPKAVFLNTDVNLKNIDNFCFEKERILNFNKNRLITGINIVDDMLFWTDNFTEPKKINIPRSIEGTDSAGNTHTAIVNNAASLNLSNYNPIKEEHVTVIRKSPKNALTLDLISSRDQFLNYSGVVNTIVDGGSSTQNSIIYSSNPAVEFDFLNLAVGDVIKLEVKEDLNNNTNFVVNWEVNNFVLLKEFNSGVSDPVPLDNFTIRCRINDWVGNNFDSYNGAVQVELEVINVVGTPLQPDQALVNDVLSFTIDLEDNKEVIFEDKLPRFSYRYKYEDGEYSTFAPWSQVAFLPSFLSYDSTGGFNKGMTNHVTSIKLKGFKTLLPGFQSGQDVIEIDILYKEDSSPNVYIVQTLSPLDLPQFGSNIIPWWSDEYEITSETIKSLLPSNQLLRPWDNVPKKALAQAVTGSRIVYGNYEQNYDLKVGSKKYKPSFKNYLDYQSIGVDGSAQKSIKSLRNYKLGVVFTDEYGRETPVIISESGGFKVEKINSKTANRLAVGLRGSAPENMAFFKFYIKETSTEYYNLPMDRWYNAEDGNIWLAFPSLDRNKIDLETSLYFKKGSNDNVIENTTRYKVLAIENEAPDFIKTRRIRIGSATHYPGQVIAGNNARLFGTAGQELQNAPKVNNISFHLNYEGGNFANSSMSNLEDIREDLYVQFASSTKFSSQYKVSEVTSDREKQAALVTPLPPSKYFVTLDTNLKDDISFIFDDPSNPTKIQDDVKIVFTKAILENAAKFDGRFFAKIENDGKIQTQISDDSVGTNYVETASKMVYVLDDDETLMIRSSNTAISTSGANRITQDYSNLSSYTLALQDTTGPYSANPNGLNWNYSLARQAFFGNWIGSNITSDADTTGGINNSGVWFIDRSTKKYSRPGDDNDLYWDGTETMNEFTPQCNIIGVSGCGTVPHTPTNSLFQGLGKGIENNNSSNSSYINLSFGGIASRSAEGRGLFYHFRNHSTTQNSSTWWLNINGSQVFENFFSIGEGTGTYGDPETTKFVSSLGAGFRFKWENDPTETVYTIEGETRLKNNVRFGRWDHGGNFPGTHGSTGPRGSTLIARSSSYSRSWGFSVSPQLDNGSIGWDPANGDGGGVGTYMHNGLALGSGTKNLGTTNLFLAFDLLTATAAGATTFTFDLSNDISGIQEGMLVVNQDTSNAVNPGTLVTNVDTTTNTVTFSPGTVGACSPNDDIEFAFAINLVEEYIYGLSQSIDVTENYIKVDNITTACSNGNTLNPTYSLHKGMMLDRYNIDNSAVNSGTAPGVTGTRENNVIIKDITYDDADGNWRIDLTGYHTPLHYDYSANTSTATEFSTSFIVGKRLQFRQVAMNGASNKTEENTVSDAGGANSENSKADLSGGIGAVGYKMIMVEPVDEYGDGGNLPPDPFVWETEPKEAAELDIYYEISENNPVTLNNNTVNSAIPTNSLVTSDSGEGAFNFIQPVYTLSHGSVLGNEILLSTPVWIGPGLSPNGAPPLTNDSKLKITKPNGTVFEVVIDSIPSQPSSLSAGEAVLLILKNSLYNSTYFLNWHNCYSFGNGVESNRIKDTFNSPFMTNGVKVSTILNQEYIKEHRKHGLIYSGIYNSNSGVNNLNQFIQAEQITKDINPIYGSIQKLHSGWGQSGDLVALCEDRVLRILANKDALFNADGNTNVTATNKVLGTATPYSGEFGISKNPESFASEAYRAYFTDKVRGAVMRLSIDGLTPISSHGMKDWFRDNLKLNNKLIGSYDDRKDQYNITLPTTNDSNISSKTVTFKEDVRGWVSFKSFVPENAISCANEYYTFKDGNLWKHHHEIKNIDGTELNRNTFYKTEDSNNNFTASSLKVILGDSSGIIKTFHTLNYEGSQSKIDQFRGYDTFLPGTTIVNEHYDFQDNDQIGYYNLKDIKGWYVETVKTNLEEGSLNEFIKKEGKWFNYIKGKEGSLINTRRRKNIKDGFNNADFSFQGIARVAQVSSSNVPGCMDPSQFNYDPLATDNNGTCIPFIYGCMDVAASNYYSAANTSTTPSNCLYPGCMDSGSLLVSNGDPYDSNHPAGCVPGVDCQAAINYDAAAGINVDDGSCIYPVLGCTDDTAYNYDPNANTDDGSCIAIVLGCIDNGNQPNGFGVVTDINGDGMAALNYDPTANTNDGSCIHIVYGCTTIGSCNYDPNANIDDNSCTPGGCTDTLACNYDSTATCDNGSCLYCGSTGTSVMNYDGADPTCTSGCITCQPPVGVTVSATDTTITVNWSAPATGPLVAPVGEGYLVRLFSSDANGSPVSGLNSSGIPTSPLLTFKTVDNTTFTTDFGGSNVQAGTYYTVQVLTHCATSPTLITTLPGFTNPNIGQDVYGDSGLFYGIQTLAAPIPGCTDDTQFNYNPAATVDDGSCTPVVNGCTDPNAVNYNSSANTDDGSCCVQSAMPTLACWETATFNTTTCSWDITGTQDSNIFVVGQQIPYSTGGASASHIVTSCDTVAFNNVICTWDFTLGTSGYGCTDPNAFNYDSNATCESTPSTCVAKVLGCTDNGNAINGAGVVNDADGDGIAAFNYSPTANTDDGSCVQVVYGCTDNTAFNYNPIANVNEVSATDSSNPCQFPGSTTTATVSQTDANGGGTIFEAHPNASNIQQWRSVITYSVAYTPDTTSTSIVPQQQFAFRFAFNAPSGTNYPFSWQQAFPGTTTANNFYFSSTVAAGSVTAATNIDTLSNSSGILTGGVTDSSTNITSYGSTMNIKVSNSPNATVGINSLGASPAGSYLWIYSRWRYVRPSDNQIMVGPWVVTSILTI